MARLALVLVALPLLAWGDVIWPKTGSRPLARNVKVVEEGEKVVYLDKALKRRAWPRNLVGRIEKRSSDVHVYFEKYEAAQDAAAVMALAEWAAATKFHKDVVRALWERALELDPNHEGANRALGRVRYQGEWMTPAEKVQRENAAAEAAMRAKGLVKWKDQWVTPEDKEKLDQGLRRYQGRWMTEEEIKEAEGYVKHDGKWVKRDELEVLKIVGPARKDTGLGNSLVVVQTEHYAILGDLPQPQLQTLGKTMERLLQEWMRVFPDADPSELVPGKHRLFAFRKNRPYQRLVRARYERQKKEEDWSDGFAKQEKARMNLRLRETSFWEVQPEVFSAHVQMPDPFEGLRAHCVHFGANILATRHARTRFPTWWMNEGLAYYFEKKLTGSIQTQNVDVGAGKYADVGPADAVKNPWLDAAKWPGLLTGLVRSGRDPKLDQMKGKNLYEKKNRLTIRDIAKAWSVATFLIQDDPKTFAAFFRDCKEGSGSPVEREVAAVLKHYGSYAKLDKGWRAYALNGFRVAR